MILILIFLEVEDNANSDIMFHYTKSYYIDLYSFLVKA